MTITASLKTICPCKVAEKLEAVRNFLLPEVEEELAQMPRLAEAMWFLEWVSQPNNFSGGLSRFASEFIKECSNEIGPAELADGGPRQLSAAEIEAILDVLPGAVIDELIDDTSTKKLLGALLDSRDGILGDYDFREIRALRLKALCRVTYERLHAACKDGARKDLASFFFDVCTCAEVTFSGVKCGYLRENRLWYWPGLWNSFLAWLDRRNERFRRAIAETSITREVFRWLRLAEDTGKGVMIVGSSRFGKTEAIRAYAGMNPGRVRFIETPDSSSVRDLLREIARALGLPHRLSHEELRTSIDFVLRQSRMMLIFDESQFLFPTRYGRRGDPPRLNYIRRAIMDLGLPTAFIYTPQSWKRVEKNYLKTSGYSIEQFEGRLLRSPIFLRDEIPFEDMLEVARVHFPELSKKGLDLVAGALKSAQGSILSSFDNVSRLARTYAREAAKSAIDLEDIFRALNDVAPGTLVDQEVPTPVEECKTPSRRELQGVNATPRRVTHPNGNRLSEAVLSAIG